jgi:hypothetical protein
MGSSLRLQLNIVQLSLANVFRCVVLLVLAAHVFYMYCLARANAGTFGFELGTTVVGALFALVMLIPLVWAVTLPELPEIYSTHIRARRWWRQHRCCGCGYSRVGLDVLNCPECGRAIEPPRDYAVNVRTVVLFIAMNLFAWILGCTAAEALYSADERAFMQEVARHEAQGDAEYRRQARWPSSGILMWNEFGYQHARGGVLSASQGPTSTAESN